MLEPAEGPAQRSSALTRAHTTPGSSRPIRASERLKAAESARKPAINPGKTRTSSGHHRVSASSTRTALGTSTASGVVRVGSARLPASLLLGPDPQRARRKTRRLIIIMALLILLPIPLILGLRQLTRPNEQNARAILAVQEVEQRLVLIRDAIAARRTADALQTLLTCRQSLEGPTPTDALLVERIKVLRGQCESMRIEAEAADREHKAQAAYQVLVARFNRQAELDATGLDALERSAKAFVANPVAPGTDLDAALLAPFQQMMDDVRRRIDGIALARQRDAAAQASMYEAKARVEIAELVRSERFQAALDRIGEYRTQHPQGKFDEQQQFVENAAKRSWEAAKVYAESRLADARTPGIPAVQRQQVVTEARRRLKEVIERFGIAAHVDEAKALLGQLPE
jgi:hypothetical protein